MQLAATYAIFLNLTFSNLLLDFKMASKTLAIIALFGFCFLPTASAEPHCQKCPYSCFDLGLGKKECSNLTPARGVCCVDLTEKGLKVALAQEQILAANKPAPKVETCPNGFQPSERKCSQDERRHGCKDMRLPGGLGCVKR